MCSGEGESFSPEIETKPVSSVALVAVKQERKGRCVAKTKSRVIRVLRLPGCDPLVFE